MRHMTLEGRWMACRSAFRSPVVPHLSPAHGSSRTPHLRARTSPMKLDFPGFPWISFDSGPPVSGFPPATRSRLEPHPATSSTNNYDEVGFTWISLD